MMRSRRKRRPTQSPGLSMSVGSAAVAELSLLAASLIVTPSVRHAAPRFSTLSMTHLHSCRGMRNCRHRDSTQFNGSSAGGSAGACAFLPFADEEASRGDLSTEAGAATAPEAPQLVLCMQLGTFRGHASRASLGTHACTFRRESRNMAGGRRDRCSARPRVRDNVGTQASPRACQTQKQ